MKMIRLAALALFLAPAAALADSGLAEGISSGRMIFDRGGSVGVQDGPAVTAEEGEKASISFVLPTAVDGQGTEADPIPLPRRAKRPRGLSANFDQVALDLLGNPRVPIRPTGIVLLGLLAALATGMTAGGLLTEN